MESEKIFEGDVLLWNELRSGNQDAYEKIYRKHLRELYEYACRFTSDKQAIHDCLQDLFVDLWIKRERITETNDRILFYLMKALRNRLFRMMNNSKRMLHQEELPENYNFELVISQEIILIEEQQENDQKKLLLQSLEQLSDRQREAVYLRFYKNLDYNEIASIMQLEQQSAYNLIFRALQSLRKKLSSPFLLLYLLLAIS